MSASTVATIMDMETKAVEEDSTSNAFRTAKSRLKVKLSTCVKAMPKMSCQNR